jgi:hypothetical protein
MSLTKNEGPEEGAGQPTAPAPAQKRPYIAPQLRRLGSVAELTLGAAGSVTDGGPGSKFAG